MSVEEVTREAIDAAHAEQAADTNGGSDATEGMTIEQMAAQGIVEDETGQSLLDFGDHTNLSVKGKKPDSSWLKIRSVSRRVKGQIGDQGDDVPVAVLIMALPDEVNFKASRDTNQKVVSKARKSTLTPDKVVRLPIEVAQALIEQYA